jgi:unsaturated chondroitin disaccharide hydrolase
MSRKASHVPDASQNREGSTDEVPTSLENLWRSFVRAGNRETRNAVERDADLFPHYTEGQSWHLMRVEERSRWLPGGVYEHGNWTAGFSIGVRWLTAIGQGETNADEHAVSRLRALAPRSDDSTTHDLGFLFYPSFVVGHELGFVGPESTTPAFRAADMTAARFNSRGDFIQAFGAIGDRRSAGTSTIDTMLNLPLIWWATARGADPVLYDIARRHARTSARLFFRENGSTYHLNRFDPVSGALIHRGTFQGAGDDSCWSRGQAWAIAGFAWAYAATGEPELLSAAEKAADYYWSCLPADGIPPWDFSDTSPDATQDASASAIAALGAEILAHVHNEPAGRSRNRTAGEALLLKLATCVNEDPEQDGILLRCCYSQPHSLGINGAMGWGDFFFGLALALATSKISIKDVLGFTPEAGGVGHPLAKVKSRS